MVALGAQSLIRESGTEPLVRVMAEGEDPAVVAEVVDHRAGRRELGHDVDDRAHFATAADRHAARAQPHRPEQRAAEPVAGGVDDAHDEQGHVAHHDCQPDGRSEDPAKDGDEKQHQAEQVVAEDGDSRESDQADYHPYDGDEPARCDRPKPYAKAV